jgi:predicted 3-demethylubiquinone-9 3-methyltransferase (glyoxalase superfamily)
MTLTTCLWFDTEAEEAAKFYTSVFPDSKQGEVSYYGEGGPRPSGSVMTAAFEIQGQQFVGLNAGPEFRFNEAISFQVPCQDQAEIDRYWDSLLEGGGEESQCGWLKDRFGVSWQVFPSRLPELLGDPDPGRSSRAMQAMMTMKKIDLAAIERAAGSA